MRFKRRKRYRSSEESSELAKEIAERTMLRSIEALREAGLTPEQAKRVFRELNKRQITFILAQDYLNL